jgi:hypothetical protein
VRSKISRLFSLLVLADIDLSGPSALTLVAPTNDAFALLDSAVAEFLTTTAEVDRAESNLAIPRICWYSTSTIW